MSLVSSFIDGKKNPRYGVLCMCMSLVLSMYRSSKKTGSRVTVQFDKIV